ncbi:MAG: hypothetical protein V4719_27340 [Planctomycetota bacterium]
MRTFNPRSVIGAALLISMVALGCGSGVDDPYDRVGFSGTVQLDGAPMKSGFLYLEPLEKQPTQSFAVIQDGRFEVERAAGAVPGRYRVAIILDESSELPEGVDPQTPEGAAIADRLSKKPAAKPLHPSYNVSSKLVAELQTDTINEFDFDLKSNPEK